MLNRKFVTFITCFIAILDCCVCFQGSSFNNLEFASSSNTKFDASYNFDEYLFNVNNKERKFKDNKDIDELDKLSHEYWNQMQQNDVRVDSSEIIQILDSEISQYLNVSKYPGELCNRVCKKGEHRVCYFEFTLEFYQAMGAACGRCRYGVEEDCNNPQCIVADGIEKGVMSINRQIPGPAIQICKHDLVIVDVHNRADGTAATLHWHGIHMVKTPFMDGVPFVTQCPIQYANTFRYEFNATEAGTQFYHSHSGHHKANGQYGVLNVRQPKEDEPLALLYDYDLPEHHVFIADWMHTYAEHLSPGLPSSEILPDSVLINGRGVIRDPTSFKVRPTIYYVIRGKRYLFRLVDGGSHNCPFILQIKNHKFTIVASDSYTVIPRDFDTLAVNSGERYDFVLNANKKIGDYWMRIRGLGNCATKQLESYALIRYIDEEFYDDDDYLDIIKKSPIPPFPNYHELFPDFRVLNHPNATCWDGESNKCITELSAFEDDEELYHAKPDHQFFLAFSNYMVPNKEVFQTGRYFHFENVFSNLTLVAAINKLSLVFPDSPPLTQPQSIDKSQICDSTNRPERCKYSKLCHCVHILKVKKNSIVELIIVDESPAISLVNHPFHLHGYRFMVTGMGQDPYGLPMTVNQAKYLEHKRMLPRDFNTSPIFKDTVSIPSHGYVILRLRATNPGFWLMHCHYEWHASVGMGLVLQVGETSEMVKAPSDFPTCGNYVPHVKKPHFE